MKKYIVETVQDSYGSYTVEADSPGAARAIVQMALSNTSKDKQLQEQVLSSYFPNGWGDTEEIIDVTESQE